MNKKFLLSLMVGSCLLAIPAVQATTLEEETGITADGRTAGGFNSKGNFNLGSLRSSNAEAATIEPAAGNANGVFDISANPVNAKPGECYGKVTMPAVKQTKAEKVLIAPAGKKIARIAPAEYKTVTEQLTIADASEKLITIPATYKTVTETIVVKPETTRMVRVPAKYETVKEKVMVSPARSVWKPGEGPNQRVGSNGEIMCLVEVPAEYKTVSKRVLVSPETTRQEIIPAVTEKVTRKVVDQPARIEKQIIPPVTKEFSKTVLVKPEQPIYEKVAAKYKTVEREVIVAPEKVTWSQILCKTNASSDTVATMQSALKEAGYNPGRVDGILGNQTYSAVNRFQRDNNLHRGQITMETLKALGVSS